MKSIKIYLGIVSVLLVISIGIGVYVWYLIQNLDTQMSSEAPTPAPGKNTEATTGTSGVKENVPTVPTKPITVDTSTLPLSQQKLLETFGFPAGSFTITPEMITCGENAVGKQRLADIVNGEKPGPIESVELFRCFKK